MPIEFGDTKFYTLDEIAKAFNVTKITIRSYLKEGKLRGEKMGKRWYVSEESIKEFFNKEKTRSPGWDNTTPGTRMV